MSQISETLESFTILQNQPSFVDNLSHFLSPISTDLVNASSVIPTISNSKWSEWDKNLSILQNLQNDPPNESFNLLKEMKRCNPNCCVESMRQGLKYAIIFNNANNQLILIIQSIESPETIKSLTFKIEIDLVDSNCEFKLIELPPCLNVSKKFESFIISYKLITKTEETAKMVINVSDMNSISIQTDQSDDSNQLAFLLNSPMFAVDSLRYDVMKFSQSGKSWCLTGRDKCPSVIFRNEEMIPITYPLVSHSEFVDFLDDEWFLWKSCRCTRITRTKWYLYHIDSKKHHLIDATSSSSLSKYQIYLVGKSFILVVSKVEKQKSILLNVVTQEKFEFKTTLDQEIDQIFVVGSGLFKYSFVNDKKDKKDKQFITFDVDNDSMINIDG